MPAELPKAVIPGAGEARILDSNAIRSAVGPIQRRSEIHALQVSGSIISPAINARSHRLTFNALGIINTPQLAGPEE
jgi:hypothetical protein